MCLGSIAQLVERLDGEGAALGRLDDGSVVSLAFVPGAQPGTHVLVHLGIPVEILDTDAAREASALRTSVPGQEGATP